MRTTLIIAFCLFVTLSSDAYSQDAPPQFEHIKGLEPFIGVWEGKFDPPGSAPIGTVRVTCKWMSNKSYFQMEGVYVPDGAEEIQLNVANVFIGYSGKTKAVHSWHLDLGTQAEAPAKITENKVTMEVAERYGLDGNRSTRTTVYELRTPKELVARHTKITKDGESKPDEEPLVLKRVK